MLKRVRNYFVFCLVVLCHNSFAAKNDECNFELKSKHCVKIHFDDVISRKKDASFNFSLFDGSKNITKSVDDLNFKLWMVMKNGHGHGSDEVVIAPSKDGKTLHITNVWFLMLGKWELKITYKYDGENLSGVIPVCVMKNQEKSHLGACK